MQFSKVVTLSLNEFCVKLYEKYPYLPSIISQLNRIDDEPTSPTKKSQPILISPLKSQLFETHMKNKAEENSVLKSKVDHLYDVADKMRHDYFKELNHYREQDRMRKKRLAFQAHLTVDEEEEKIAIPVEFFDALEGIDDKVLGLVNEKIE